MALAFRMKVSISMALSLAACLVARSSPADELSAEKSPSETRPAPAPTDPLTGRLVGSWARVQAELARGNVGEAQRLAMLLPARLWQQAFTAGGTAASQAADATLTALTVLPAMIGAVAWLPDVARLIVSSHPAAQARAGRAIDTLGVLLDQHEPDSLESWEVPPRSLASVCSALAFVAGAPERPLEVRLAALQALARSAPVCPAPAEDLLVDRLPEIRRAAVLVLPATPSSRAGWVARLDDEAPEVQSAAAARLCGDSESAAPEGALLQVARHFALEPTAVEDSVELLGCLARSAEGTDRILLETVSRRGGVAVQERARDLLAR